MARHRGVTPMPFIIKNTETGKYVARAGSQHSYTRKLEDARLYPTIESARADRCVDNEAVYFFGLGSP
jgi:hypothetical protein